MDALWPSSWTSRSLFFSSHSIPLPLLFLQKILCIISLHSLFLIEIRYGQPIKWICESYRQTKRAPNAIYHSTMMDMETSHLKWKKLRNVKKRGFDVDEMHPRQRERGKNGTSLEIAMQPKIKNEIPIDLVIKYRIDFPHISYARSHFKSVAFFLLFRFQ